MLVNLAVAAALAVAGATLLTALETLRYLAGPGRRTPRRAASPPTPALVNVLLTSASPGAAAYQATLLDLAARGLLTARTGPAGLWLAPASTAPASTVPTRTVPPTELPTLMDHERLAMQTTLRRLASAGGAPFEAAAEACTVDVAGTWQPFEEALRREARRAGLTRPTLPARGSTFLLFCAITAGVAGAALLAAAPLPHLNAALTSTAAAIMLWILTGWLARQDRLTPAGRRLARQLKQHRATLANSPYLATQPEAGPAAAPPGPNALHNGTPASATQPATSAANVPPDPAGTQPSPDVLQTWALALAMRLPQARRLLAAPDGARPAQPAQPGNSTRPGRRRLLPADAPRELDRPAGAWSGYSGNWRRARTGRNPGLGLGAGFALLAAAAWIGFLAYAFTLPSGTGPLPLILGLAAAALALSGARLIAKRAAMPAQATFDGQVIARWQETENTEQASYQVPHISVDDGHQAWTFAGSWPYDQVTLGDHVRITVNPRSRALVALTVTGPGRGIS